jgi:hypothetical protein
MLRSKFHSPWQPHVSDGQLLNPSAHASESRTSFSDQIEELEGEVRMPEASQEEAAATSGSDPVTGADPAPSVAPEAPNARARWYASLVERFARH